MHNKVLRLLLIASPLIALTGCNDNNILGQIGLKDKVTDTIQLRNGIAYLPNIDTPFTGKFEKIYPNGQKAEQKFFHDGKAIGLATAWYENGQKMSEENYNNGKLDGLSTTWYIDGQKWSEENYKDGSRDGLATIWTKDGRKTTAEKPELYNFEGKYEVFQLGLLNCKLLYKLVTVTNTDDNLKKFKSCIFSAKKTAKHLLKEDIQIVTNLNTKEAFKNYYVALLSALDGIEAGLEESKINYEQRQQELENKIKDAWNRFEIER